jgi:glyoxylase-like metal-dependent hydrolase (beta-lactamase superfamily II)
MWWLSAERANCRPTPFRQALSRATPFSPGGLDRVTSPQDFTSLMDDLERRIFGVYADETLVHPGHGKPTTLGVERPRLGEWRARGW